MKISENLEQAILNRDFNHDKVIITAGKRVYNNTFMNRTFVWIVSWLFNSYSTNTDKVARVLFKVMQQQVAHLPQTQTGDRLEKNIDWLRNKYTKTADPILNTQVSNVFNKIKILLHEKTEAQVVESNPAPIVEEAQVLATEVNPNEVEQPREDTQTIAANTGNEIEQPKEDAQTIAANTGNEIEQPKEDAQTIAANTGNEIEQPKEDAQTTDANAKKVEQAKEDTQTTDANAKKAEKQKDAQKTDANAKKVETQKKPIVPASEKRSFASNLFAVGSVTLAALSVGAAIYFKKEITEQATYLVTDSMAAQLAKLGGFLATGVLSQYIFSKNEKEVTREGLANHTWNGLWTAGTTVSALGLNMVAIQSLSHAVGSFATGNINPGLIGAVGFTTLSVFSNYLMNRGEESRLLTQAAIQFLPGADHAKLNRNNVGGAIVSASVKGLGASHTVARLTGGAAEAALVGYQTYTQGWQKAALEVGKWVVLPKIVYPVLSQSKKAISWMNTPSKPKAKAVA